MNLLSWILKKVLGDCKHPEKHREEEFDSDYEMVRVWCLRCGKVIEERKVR